MSPTYAVVLENWFCQTSYLEIRGGYSSHATAMTGIGKTLATYNSLSGTNYMFCTTASGIYDVSSAGAVGASVLARTSGKHQWINFGDGTNNYLILVNGVDKPAYFNGSAWVAVDNATVPALTGLTTTKIVGVNSFKGRLFFIEKDSLSFWYLAAGAAGGALTEFPLDGEAKRGGYLMAMATWTIDGGDGLEDRAVFVTSEGDVIVYAGTNPSSSTSWAKVGSYFLGKPLGRRCFTQFGGDIVLLTENGAFPLASSLQASSIDYKVALSFNIENDFTEAARSYGSNFGWRAEVLPARSALLVNIPKSEDGEHEQYVMNTITKAWCKFKEWDAEDFCVYNKELYFCQGTSVFHAWSGVSDNGADIVAYGKTAFNYFGTRGLLKQILMFQPVLTVNGSLSFLTDIDVDFKDTPITGTATYSPISTALWGVSLWGVGLWGSGSETVSIWTSPDEHPGYCAAGKVKIATKSLNVRWNACNYVWTPGGMVG